MLFYVILLEEQRILEEMPLSISCKSSNIIWPFSWTLIYENVFQNTLKYKWHFLKNITLWKDVCAGIQQNITH
jgi:hypothetical protein